MFISRRSFFRRCAATAAVLGMAPADLLQLRGALAATAGPAVLWLQGSGCSGCSMSFLNYVSPTPPRDVADLLITRARLAYHPTLSAAAGATAVEAAVNPERFVLVVEGGVPTAFEGHGCSAWAEQGQEVTFQEAVRRLAAKAEHVVCVGACAAYGGVSSMGANPAGVVSVQKAIGKPTINVPGCPPHPDWMVATLMTLLLGKTIALDDSGRPVSIFGGAFCHDCPNHRRGEANRLGVAGMCLERLNCQGRSSVGDCPTRRWNNGVNWCVGAGAPCQGCTSPGFPSAPTRGEGRGRGPGRGGNRRGFRGGF